MWKTHSEKNEAAEDDGRHLEAEPVLKVSAQKWTNKSTKCTTLTQYSKTTVTVDIYFWRHLRYASE